MSTPEDPPTGTPGGSGAPGSEAPEHAASEALVESGFAAADGGDFPHRFYQGTIVRLFPGSLTGVLRTGSGREVAFGLSDLRLLGTTRGFAALREGMRVGFDLGWTAHGRRVTTIRVSDAGGG